MDFDQFQAISQAVIRNTGVYFGKMDASHIALTKIRSTER
jgi:hypothetical protein